MRHLRVTRDSIGPRTRQMPPPESPFPSDAEKGAAMPSGPHADSPAFWKGKTRGQLLSLQPQACVTSWCAAHAVENLAHAQQAKARPEHSQDAAVRDMLPPVANKEKATLGEHERGDKKAGMPSPPCLP